MSFSFSTIIQYIRQACDSGMGDSSPVLRKMRHFDGVLPGIRRGKRPRRLIMGRRAADAGE
jgi:hypothetical protein